MITLLLEKGDFKNVGFPPLFAKNAQGRDFRKLR
jgi:hypothetical protein